MKSIKLMLLIAAMLLPLNIHAQKPQDAYRQTIELLINKGQQKEQMQMQIAQVLQQQDQNNPQMAKMQKYFTSDDFLNDIIDMYEEALRPRLTLEQLQHPIPASCSKRKRKYWLCKCKTKPHPHSL